MVPKRIILFIVILLLAVSSVTVKAARPDPSLYNTPYSKLVERYKSLMESLKKEKNPDSQTQIAILSTLMDMAKPEASKGFKLSVNVKSQKGFMRLLERVASLKSEYVSTQGRIGRIEKKLKALKKDIDALENNSSDLLTYQLQYALYEITKKRLHGQLEDIEKALKEYRNLIHEAFERVDFDAARARMDLKEAEALYEHLDDMIERLNVEQDRLSLINDQRRLKTVVKKLKRLLKERDSVALRIIEDYMIIGFSQLKHSKAPSVDGEIEDWLDRLHYADNKQFADELNSLFYYITERKLGKVKTFIRNIGKGSEAIVDAVVGLLTKPIFTIGNSKVSILSILIALLVFVAGIYVGKLYKVRIRESKFGKSITLSTRTIVANVGYYTIILITFFIGLRIIGVNLSSLTVILGALSVGIGFGLQNMVSNFISGIILMLENSIRIGDYVEISQDLKGVVKDIQMRSTTIVTNDNIEVIVPNQTLFQNNVINWTLTEKVRRFRIPFSVAYGTSVDRVVEVVLSALESSDLNYIKGIKGKEPEVKMVAMADSSVDFNLDVWVEGDDVLYPRRTISRFLIMIYNALYESGIQIPFPQMDIHFKEPLVIEKRDD